MNRIQKLSWFMVITTSLGVIASIIAISILYVKFGFPKASAGLGFLGIAGLGGLGPLIFKKDKGKITCDERDKLIHKRAALTGFTAAYLFAGLACMIPFSVLGPDASVRAMWLPMIFMGAGITNFFVHSVAILIQYGRGGNDD